ncbi:MAG: hypothetical protein ACRD0W_08300 [Acidimicrobiales bacterium]
MIPTMIVFGLIFGRWWRLTLIVAAFGWPLLLVTTNVMNVEVGLVGAAVLAVLNTGVGVAIHQAGLAMVRTLRRQSARAPVRP